MQSVREVTKWIYLRFSESSFEFWVIPELRSLTSIEGEFLKSNSSFRVRHEWTVKLLIFQEGDSGKKDDSIVWRCLLDGYKPNEISREPFCPGAIADAQAPSRDLINCLFILPPTQQQLRCIQDIFEFHLDDDNVKTNEHEWKIKLGQDGNQELSYQPLSPQLEAKTRLGNHITSAQLFGLAITFHLTILVGWKWNLMMTRMEKLMPELLSAIKWPLALTHVRTSPRTDITFN